VIDIGDIPEARKVRLQGEESSLRRTQEVDMKGDIEIPGTHTAERKRGGRREGARTAEADCGPPTGQQNQHRREKDPAIDATESAAAVPFDFHGKIVRTIYKNGEVWFVAGDVCDVLDHTNSRTAISSLDDDERDVSVLSTRIGLRTMNLINESGLYNLVLSSRLPEAKAFRRWVTGVVLPTIRRTGKFDMTDQPEQSTIDQDQVCDSNAITITLPRWGRYIVVAAPDGERRVQPICVSDAISVMATLDCRAVAYAHMTTVMFWEKLQHLRASHVEVVGGFSLEKLNESILAGADLARQILYTYDKPRLNLHD
jgi:prophage antirepressor-like protein